MLIYTSLCSIYEGLLEHFLQSVWAYITLDGQTTSVFHKSHLGQLSLLPYGGLEIPAKVVRNRRRVRLQRIPADVINSVLTAHHD